MCGIRVSKSLGVAPRSRGYYRAWMGRADMDWGGHFRSNQGRVLGRCLEAMGGLIVVRVVWAGWRGDGSSGPGGVGLGWVAVVTQARVG